MVGGVAVAVGCANGDALFSESPPASGGASQGANGPGPGPGPGAGGSGLTPSQGGMGGEAPPPICSSQVVPIDSCDPICDSCNAGICTFSCDGDGDSCEGETITCPTGLYCNVSCVNGGCRGTTIACPDAFQCNLFCNGDDACRDATLDCKPEAVCKVVCQEGDDVCRDTTLRCDNNWCFAQCTDGVAPVPNVECDNAGGCPCATCEG